MNCLNFKKKALAVIKYILISVLIIFIIPKESFYKNEKIKLKIEYLGPEYINNNFYQKMPLGYIFENSYKKIQNKNILEYEFQYKIIDKYILELFGTNENSIKKIELKSKNKIVNLNEALSIDQKKEKYNWIEINKKNILKIGEVSYIKILVFFTIIFLLVKNLPKIIFIKNRRFNKIGMNILSLNFLILALNPHYLSKISAIFISITLIYFIKTKFKLNFVYICAYFIFIYIFFSNSFEFEKIIKGYEYYWNSLLYLISILIWNFNQDEKEIIHAYLFIGIYISTLLGITSPNIFNGLYTFTYGTIAMILFIFSVQKLLYFRKNKISFEFLIYISGIIISLLGIGESGRRTVFVVLLMYCIYIVIKIFIKKINKRNIPKIMIGIFLIGLVLNAGRSKLPDELLLRANSILNFKKDYSAQQRIFMWRRSFYILLEEPLKGIGTDNFYKEIIKNKYNSLKITGENFQEDFIHPHNEYLNNLVSKGLIAGVIYIYLLYLLLKSAIIDRENDNNLYRGILICFSIFGIFEPYSMRMEAQIFWSFMGMMLLESKTIKNIENEKINIIGKICILSIFLVGLYINKRFRYYFPLILLCYYIYYWIEKRREKNIEKSIDME